MTVRPPDPTQLESWETVLLRTAYEMSLSPSQYELIEQRYNTLQEALDAADNPLLADAHIFVQGSIRLRTTIKPADGAKDDMATIDADAIVWLPNATSGSAAEVLKAIKERFVASSRVHAPIEELRRGIRIVYADEDPGFHIDVTPARPVPGNHEEEGEGALVVPDRHTGWKASSPIPYADWLEAVGSLDIRIVDDLLTKRAAELAEATQAPMPDYDDYMHPNPLRAAVKLLKRHRDEWAIENKKENIRPISVVITTLAAHAYEEIARRSQLRPYRTVEAIMAIVAAMPNYVGGGPGTYQVLNPRDPGENFAEKWNRPAGEGAAYKKAFDDWVVAAADAFQLGLVDQGSNATFRQRVAKSFGVSESLVEEAVRDLPGDWTLPGRAEGATRSSDALSRLTGASGASTGAASSVRSVGRLG